MRSLFLSVVLASLLPAAAWAEEVIVTAPKELSELPEGSQVTIIDPRDLVSSSLEIKEVLSRSPGVFVSTGNGLSGEDTASIRGFSSRQIAVLIDGVPMADGGNASAELGKIPVSLIDRIIVVRGPNSARFGSGAMGGVIHVITKKRVSQSRAGMSYGSYSTFRLEGDTSTDSRAGKISLSAHGDSSKGDYPFRNPRTGSLYDSGSAPSQITHDNNSSSAYGAQISGILNPETLPASGSVAYEGRKKGVPGILGRQLKQVSERDEDVHARAGLGTFKLAGFRTTLDATASFDFSKKDYNDPEGELTGFASRYIRHDRRQGLVVSPSTSLSDALTLNTKLRGEYESFNDTSLSKQRATGTASASLDIVVLRGVWGDQWVMTPAVSATGATELAPVQDYGLSSRYRLSEAWALKGNVGSGFRYPTFDELFLDRGIYVGNPSLRPEKTLGYDLGVELVQGEAKYALTYFRSRTRDLIEYVLMSGFQYKAINFGEVETEGLELEATARPWKRLELSSGMTAQKAIQRGGNNDGLLVPARPRYYGSTGAIYTLTSEIKLRSSVDMAFERFANDSNTQPIADRIDCGTAVQYEPWKDLKLGFEVKNLLDRENLDVRGFPLQGRSYYGSISKSL